MSMLELYHRVKGRIDRTLGKDPGHNANDFYVAPAEAESRLERSALVNYFIDNKSRALWKWGHYFPIYDKHFERFRGSAVKMLEIGIYKGGSLQMWRDYFGETATIFGIDINPAFAQNVDEPNQARIGSQDDPQFLHNVVDEMGGIDLVLDDGSHMGPHQRASFMALFPRLNEGGLYLIEDLHTSYWRDFGGGYHRPSTGLELVKQLIDDMHHWYHDKHVAEPAGKLIGAIHVYDSIVIVEKRTVPRPFNTEIGTDADHVIPGYEQVRD
jgi:hypothetical protein